MIKSVVKSLIIIALGTFLISLGVVILSPYWHQAKFGRKYNPSGCTYLRYPDNIPLRDKYDLQILAGKARDLHLKTQYTPISDGSQLNLEFTAPAGPLHYVALRDYQNQPTTVLVSYRIDRGCLLPNQDLYSQTIGVLDALGLETDWVARQPLSEFFAQ